MRPSVWFPIHRIGPYHHARFEAASARLNLTVLETRPASREYTWDPMPEGAYRIVRLPVAADPETDLPAAAIDEQLRRLMRRAGRPEVLVCMGWADRISHRLLLLSRAERIPLLMVSDSRFQDQPRRWPQEWIKRLLLRQASAALVAGSQSRAYLQRLGFPPEAIFQPWDVVDNALFGGEGEHMPRPNLKHVLCVSRLVQKKNHLTLIEAYRSYQQQGGQWGLRLVGSGPMEPAIQEALRTLPHPERAWLEPFQQLEALRRCYLQASAFVLPSSTDQWGLVVNEAMAAGCPVLVSQACGCAVDLVTHGTTGFVFPPHDAKALSALLHHLEQLPPERSQELAAAARSRLASFSLSSFADGLSQAVAFALQHPRSSGRATMVATLLS